ncbi:MAG TPA: DUF5985 family protein [Noviherbaspirillum sp.]
MTSFNGILTGAIAMASATISLFFFSYWKSTRDRFFVFFGTSFLLEAINRILLGVTSMHGEDEPAYYLIRLVAYALILIAILDKNRGKTKD